MQHLFDIDIAEKYSVNLAIFLKNLAYWIMRNQANNEHFHDGRYWTYNTVDAFVELFPYWNADQIRRIIKNGIKEGLIVKGNYNKKGYDQTLWYALTDEGLSLFKINVETKNEPTVNTHLAKTPNGFGENTKPIPNVNTDNKLRSKSLCLTAQFFDMFYNAYPKKIAPRKALKAFEKIKNMDEDMILMIVADIKNRLANDAHWQDKKYIPYPATYLNEKYWESEITPITAKKKTAELTVLERCLPAVRRLTNV